MEGPANFDPIDYQAALSIAQLIVFNAIKRPRKTSTDHVRIHVSKHQLCQETPMPIYLGLMLHSFTRKKHLIEKCFKLGLSISYHRVLKISNKITNNICSQYNSLDLACPVSLRKSFFTVAAVDNLDQNLSSHTAQSSFHGTAISLMQIPNKDLQNVECGISLDLTSDSTPNISLPKSYIDVPPCYLPNSQPHVPFIDFSLVDVDDSSASEYGWWNKVLRTVEDDTEPLNITWASYHSDSQAEKKQPLAIIVIRTVDTDVVFLAVAYFDKLKIPKLWIHFGVGKNVSFIAVHD